MTLDKSKYKPRQALRVLCRTSKKNIFNLVTDRDAQIREIPYAVEGRYVNITTSESGVTYLELEAMGSAAKLNQHETKVIGWEPRKKKISVPVGAIVSILTEVE